MNKLSVVVLTKNEQKSIQRCLESLVWCDEVNIIDDFSTDKTVNVARKYGAKIYKRKLNNDFAQQHNFAMKNSTYNWVLFVDADEIVTEELKNSIVKTLKKPKCNSYSVNRKNVFLNKELHFKEMGHSPLIRLMRKGTGEWKRAVHEYWDTDTNIGTLSGHLLHYSFDSIEDMILKISFYSKLHAKEGVKERKKAYLWKVMFYPPAKFLKKYILEEGYRDGVRGFVISTIMSLHSFLSWSYLWLNKK